MSKGARSKSILEKPAAPADPLGVKEAVAPQRSAGPALPWRVGKGLLGEEAPVLMGILNVTPDSFFDGGRYLAVDAALRRGEEMVARGAAIVDVGGESSRPGSSRVSDKEEMDRVLPVITELCKRTQVPISIDTMKARVARAALDCGAVIINDVSGLRADGDMAGLIASAGCSAVLGHMQGAPATMQQNPRYQDVVQEVGNSLAEARDALVARGVAPGRICLDPGIGFGKTPAHNCRLLLELSSLSAVGCPLLIGASRKSFLGKMPGLEQSSRLLPSIAVAVWAAFRGVCVIRTHDVGETWEALHTLQCMANMGSDEFA